MEVLIARYLNYWCIIAYQPFDNISFELQAFCDRTLQREIQFVLFETVRWCLFGIVCHGLQLLPTRCTQQTHVALGKSTMKYLQQSN